MPIAFAVFALCSCGEVMSTEPQENFSDSILDVTDGQESVSEAYTYTQTDILTETEIITETATETVTETITETAAKTARSEKPQTVSETVTADVSATVSAIVTAKPSSPVLTVSNVDFSTNKLSWQTVDGAKSYILYLLNEGSGEFEEYGELNGTSCRDEKLEPDTRYTYAVKARYTDGSTGEMSKPVSIYTYGKWGSPVQGNHIYYVDNIDTGTSSIMRACRSGENETELIRSEDSFGKILDSGKHIYYTRQSDEGIEIFSAAPDGKNEKALCGFGENYSLKEWAVYNDMLYYSYYGAYREEDEYTYCLGILDSDGKSAVLHKDGECDEADIYGNCGHNLSDIYDGFYYGAHFISDENGTLYIAWVCEEIDREASEEYDCIVTVPTGQICLYNADTMEQTYISYDTGGEYKVKDVCAYYNDTVYVKGSGSRSGYTSEGEYYELSGDNIDGYISDDGSFICAELPINAVNVNLLNGKYFYELNTYKDNILTNKELIESGSGGAHKIDDLRFDPDFPAFQKYSIYRNSIFYYNESYEYVFYDIGSAKKRVLKSSPIS
ncbi:MAG: hypothetical protein K2K57_01040 [Oscillospiraceae bacterium]|nr:hypothetical protein [Oscillospiraceae bacterium]